MKITIIRHGKVDMEWSKSCTSNEFDLACEEYDKAGIEEIPEAFLSDYTEIIYVSPLSRTADTAKGLFRREKFAVLPTIIEVPLKSFMDTKAAYPLWVWNVIGRLQWLCNSKRQPEGRRATKERANKAIDFCEEKKENCILITHGFFMKTLLKELKKRGYDIKGDNNMMVKNLQMMVAERISED